MSIYIYYIFRIMNYDILNSYFGSRSLIVTIIFLLILSFLSLGKREFVSTVSLRSKYGIKQLLFLNTLGICFYILMNSINAYYRHSMYIKETISTVAFNALAHMFFLVCLYFFTIRNTKVNQVCSNRI